MQQKYPIKHVWFDLEGTLTVHTPEFRAAHNALRYETYAEVVGGAVTDELKQKYEALYKKHGSNSSVFRSLGLASDFWQRKFADLDEMKFYKPDPRVYKTLAQLKDIVSISIFTNLKPERNLRSLEVINVNPDWFTHILTGDEIKERKPALDGFYKMIEMSQLPAENILYVGDRVAVDVIPAKEVGLQTALVWGSDKEADYSFEDFRGLLSLFEGE